MARLHIEKIKGWQVCIVSDVPLPDGRRKDYAACGPDGLADIIRRIKSEILQLNREQANAR